MNPFRWRKNHQIALVLAAILGFPVGLILGYSISGPGNYTDIAGWLGYEECFRFDYNSEGWCVGLIQNLEWGVFGTFFGTGVIFIWHLMSEK
jgi:hypothetical protein